MKLTAMIRRSFSRPKRYFVLLMVLSMFCIAFIGFVDTFFQIKYTLNYSDIVYGDYTGSIEDIQQSYTEIVDAVRNYHNVKYVIPYFMEEHTKTFEADLYGVDEDFWIHSEYEIVAGEYPKSDRELVCDMTYLYRYQINYDDMIGSEIEFHGRTYRICGLFRANRLYTNGSEDSDRICMTRLTDTPNACLYRMGTGHNSQMRSYLKESGFHVQVIDNFNDFIKKSAKIQLSSITWIVFSLLVVASAFMIMHCVSLILMKHKKHLEIYNLLGISNRTIQIGLSVKMVSALLLGLFCGMILYILSLTVVFEMFHYIAGLSASEFLQMLPIGRLMFTALLFFLVLSCLSVLFVYSAARKAGMQSGASDQNVRIKQMHNALPKKISSNCIAFRHIRVALLSTLGTALILAITLTAFHGVRSVFQATAKNAIQYEGYQYRLSTTVDISPFLEEIEFSKDSIHSESDLQEALDQYLTKLENVYPYLQKIQNEEIRKLYAIESDSISVEQVRYRRFKANISRSALSDSLRAFLTDQPAYHSELLSYGKTLNIPVTLIGLSDQELCALDNGTTGLQDGQCLVLASFTDEVSDQEQFRFMQGEDIKLETSLLKPVGQITTYKNSLIRFQNTLTLFTNLNTYQKITHCAVPTELFVRTNDESKAELDKVFRNLRYLEVFDLSVSEQTKRFQLCQKWVLAIAVFFLIAFTMFSSILMIYMRCVLFEREYAILCLLGISERFSRAVIRKEIHAILLPAFGISVGLLMLFLKFYNSTAKQVNLSTISFPVLLWAVTCVILECIGLISEKFITKQFDHYHV